MQLSDFTYSLPENQIATFPLEQRSASRLMHLQVGASKITHQQFSDLPGMLNKGDLLVFNDTKVMPARLYATKSSGGKVEILIERLLSFDTAFAHIKASKSPKPGTKLLLGAAWFEVIDRRDNLFVIRTGEGISLHALLEQFGQMPLPPYLKREAEDSDLARYQTVYANELGAVAAPTAGLHFDQDLLDKLNAQGIESAFVTLHVGAGTFLPVRVDNLDEHQMHAEVLSVTEAVVQKVEKTKAAGNQVVAVGTTTLRALETASASGELRPFTGETDLFIKPGFTFHTVDRLITNFHLPESTLLMLVGAFSGMDLMQRAYHQAVEQGYRFYSYGDAMIIDRAHNEEVTK